MPKPCQSHNKAMPMPRQSHAKVTQLQESTGRPCCKPRLPPDSCFSRDNFISEASGPGPVFSLPEALICKRGQRCAPGLSGRGLESNCMCFLWTRQESRPGSLLLPAGPRAPEAALRAGPQRHPSPSLSTGSGLSAASAGRGTLPGGNLPNASSPSTLSPDCSQQKLSRKLSLPLAAHTRRSHSSLPLISRTELGKWSPRFPQLESAEEFWPRKRR